MCRYANMRMCKLISISVGLYYQFAHQQKKPSRITRWLLYSLRTCTGLFTSDRILNVVVRNDLFFKWVSTGFRWLNHCNYFWIIFAFTSYFQRCNYFLCHVFIFLISDLANEWLNHTVTASTNNYYLISLWTVTFLKTGLNFFISNLSVVFFLFLVVM